MDSRHLEKSKNGHISAMLDYTF